LLIDSHAHLDSERYADDREAMLRRACEAGVGAVLAIGIGEEPAQMHQALEICRQFNGQPGIPKLYASAGVYPHNTPELDDSALAKLDSLLAEPEVIACGEIGLDYFYEGAPHPVQHAGLIRLRGVMHCFSGNLEQAQRSLDLGFLISYAGNLTFAKAQPLRDVAAQLPLDGLLVETDAPWLAPAPNRGKRNEPAWVVQTALVLAGLLGVEKEEIASATTKNFLQLFRLQPDVGN
jgi:TatD DNase family protein